MVTEIERKIIENALQAGKNLLSEETGFVHYHPHKAEGEKSDSIPVFENALFAYALLKTRKSEAIVQAKLLLEKLLSYQSQSTEQGVGNFPVFLHEFPFCFSRWKSADLIVPLFLSLKNFHPYLGAALRTQLSDALTKLIAFLVKELDTEVADYLTILKIAAGAFALGSHFENPELKTRGANLLDELKELGDVSVWYSRQGIASVLTSLQLVFDKISNSPWNKFWEHVEKTWHTTLGSYIGPAFDEWQRGSFPEVTLYDYYLASFTNHLPDYLLEPGINALLSVQVQFTGEQFNGLQERAFSGAIGETEWAVHSGSNFSCSLISQGRMPDPAFAKGLRPFVLQWKAGAALCSLSFEGGDYESFSYERVDDGFLLTFNLFAQNGVQRMESQDLLFYFSPIDAAKVPVEGHFSTTFKLGEKVVIETLPKVSLTFELKGGSGDFLGHLMPGNRPSQKLLPKKGPTEAFDKRIFLRAIRKPGPCCVQVKISIDS